MMAIAPFFIGHIVAMEWKEKAVAFTLMLTVVWAVLLGILPFSGMFGNRVSLLMLPVIEMFILAGVVKTRRTQLPAA